MQTNSRIIFCDCNENIGKKTLTNVTEQVLSMTVQSQYVIKVNCYEYIMSTNLPKHFISTDKFALVIGQQLWNVKPLIIVNDASLINQSSDWDEVDKINGKICFKVNLNNEGLLTDISGLSNKKYCMQVWCIDGTTSDSYLVLSQNVIIKNVTVEI